MSIDVLATEPQYLDHLAPVLRALPARSIGSVMVRRDLVERAATLGLTAIDVEPHRLPPGGLTLVAASGDLSRARKAGRRVAIMEHGYGQSYGGSPSSAHHSSYPGGRNRDADLFLSPNEHAASRDRTAYPAARVEVVGCPKLDALPHREEGDAWPVVAVSVHWDGLVAPETRTSFAQARSAFAALADRYQLLGHGHPRIIGRIANWYRRHGIEVVPDFADVCRRADVYLCDNSSTLYEFASTGRPVVVLDPTFYRTDVHHGLRFWEASTVGVRTGPAAASVVAAVERALQLDPADVEARERALDLVYSARSGAAERAAAVLGDWMREVAPPRPRTRRVTAEGRTGCPLPS